MWLLSNRLCLESPFHAGSNSGSLPCHVDGLVQAFPLAPQEVARSLPGGSGLLRLPQALNNPRPSAVFLLCLVQNSHVGLVLSFLLSPVLSLGREDSVPGTWLEKLEGREAGEEEEKEEAPRTWQKTSRAGPG